MKMLNTKVQKTFHLSIPLKPNLKKRQYLVKCYSKNKNEKYQGYHRVT